MKKIKSSAKTKAAAASKKKAAGKTSKKTAKKTVSKAGEKLKKKKAAGTRAGKEAKPKKEEKRKTKKPAAKKAEKKTRPKAKAPMKTGKTVKEKTVLKEPREIALPRKKAARIPRGSMLKMVGEKTAEAGPDFFEKTYEKIKAAKLPGEYGENRIALMIVDPWKLFAYWEARQDILSKTKGVMVLRVYDVTGKSFDGKNANLFFDITIFDRTGDGYIGVGPGRDFVVDLGVVSGSGKFTMIARSNKASTPAIKISKAEGVLPEEIYDAGPAVGYF